MPSSDKYVFVFVGGLFGLIIVGSVNPEYTLAGIILGALMGYALGSQR